MRVVGIDVAADRYTVVVLAGRHDRRPRVVEGFEVTRPELAERLPDLAGDVVAIDAPDGPSPALHVDDLSLPPKFRTARCTEVVLRAAGISVPWTTPLVGQAMPGWMGAGFEIWSALRERPGVRVVETYPHGVFLRLNGGVRPPKKTTASGRRRRRELLAEHLVLPAPAVCWSHDFLDACAAALAAWSAGRGVAEEVRCVTEGHDVTTLVMAGLPIRKVAPSRSD